MPRGKVCYLRCQLPQALEVYTEATALAKEQREIEHIVLYEKGEPLWALCQLHKQSCVRCSNMHDHVHVLSSMLFVLRQVGSIFSS